MTRKLIRLKMLRKWGCQVIDLIKLNGQKKICPRLFILTIWLYLFAICLIARSQAGYITCISSQVTAREAKAIVSLDINRDNYTTTSCSKEISLSFLLDPLAPGSSTSYVIAISNNNDVGISEVSLGYRLTITSNNGSSNLNFNLSPTKEYSLNDSEIVSNNEYPNLQDDLKTPYDKHLNIKPYYALGTSLDGGRLPCNIETRHSYLLTITSLDDYVQGLDIPTDTLTITLTPYPLS